MNGIQITFSARVARAATSSVSPTGIKRTRIKVDIPISHNHRTGELSNTWATVTGLEDVGELLGTLAVGEHVFIEGFLRLDAYEKNGRPQIGINVNAKYVNRIAAPEVDSVPQPASRAGARVMAEPEIPRWLKQDARGERRRDRRPSDRWEG